ncbi:vanillate O-demethylase oxidoreductase [Asticcacaulis biprosthecium C19]|uniref:Vanillate O-demethylase oxidoreductase n=1 Tax=Asticcacaulis biprosthecium C19 TaxID=715226 RepID=F4QTH9_9CAUL|nr:PDR/VanB family oxidoreductase [Asticcacaulis biprosthecium]EGF90049.1 vanillate O-demethylase oxidoreductase [Asticcacaulis biprosthecium C19]
MIEVVVREIVQATPAIRRITLAAANERALPPFQAGAHIDVHLPDGLVRQYSLTGQPGADQVYHIGVLNDPASRGGSQWIHHSLKPGDRLQISAPRNLFPLVETARRHILFAGGIGVTPILSMARHLSATGADFEVTYNVRDRADAAFAKDLAALCPEGRFQLMADGRDAARADCLRALALPSPDVHVYVCGPVGYIETVLDLARQQGWPDSQLHLETFAAAPTSSAGNTAFTVRLARSGLTILVAEDQTVLSALEGSGIHIPSSCEQGICGTCLTPVISGTPDHRDHYLTDEERATNDQFTPCCSRSRSVELVLDL